MILINIRTLTSTPNYMIYGELGRYPVEIDIKIRIISFSAKIICGKQSKISCIMYSLSHHLHSQQNFDIKWIQFLEKIALRTHFLRPLMSKCINIVFAKVYRHFILGHAIVLVFFA
jgi:hypothetical protein